jgi:hypothetical protein
LNGFGRKKENACILCLSCSNKCILTPNLYVNLIQKYRLHLKRSTQTLHKDDTTSSSSHPHESNNLKTQLFNHSLNSVYLDGDGCMEITDYSLPKDDLSSSSDCMLGEQNNYSPEGFQDFRWVSDKQAYDTYLWNFEAE